MLGGRACALRLASSTSTGSSPSRSLVSANLNTRDDRVRNLFLSGSRRLVLTLDLVLSTKFGDVSDQSDTTTGDEGSSKGFRQAVVPSLDGRISLTEQLGMARIALSNKPLSHF